MANKEQEHISLQIMTSEKDELINDRNHAIEKFRKKNDKLKEKLYELVQLNEGLDNRVTVTELKYFNLEKEVDEKQILVLKLEKDLSLAEETLNKITTEHKDELEKLNNDKTELMESKTELLNLKTELEDKLKQEKEATVKDREEMQKTKKFLLEQIAKIRQKSNEKIQLTVETIDIC